MKKIFFLLLLPFITLAMEKFWTNEYEQVFKERASYESASGDGSSLVQTKLVRSSFSKLIADYGITSILDIPCGDFHWMQYVDLKNCLYIGVDIVEKVIKKNEVQYATPNIRFQHGDVTKDRLPRCDLVLCRDLLVHLSNHEVIEALRNFKLSGAQYLLATTFVDREGPNEDIESGGWRPINLQEAPFQLGTPELMINEHCTEQGGKYSDKSLGLWRLQEINL